jgi:HK97 family phage major capsid protein
MKKRLQKLLQAKQEQRTALNKSLIECENREERAAIGETLSALGEEIAEIETMLAEMDEPASANGNGEGEGASANGNGEGRGLTPIATMQTRTGAPAANVDRYDTEEYRTAFMNFACRGVAIPAELRATTATTDVSAVIPTTILHEIIKEVKSFGNLYAAVRKLNVQGGVQIPILSLKPTATWVGEGASEAQKVEAKTSISFSYFGLECKIAQTLLASVTTLEMFQNLFVPLATEAMAKALDVAIMNGTGENQPLGITVDSRVPKANIITLTEEEFKSWSAWKKKVFGKMKKSYRNGVFYMAQGTFDGYIDGMVDNVGQPIGRVNYGIDGAENYRFGGKVVDTVEDEVIKAYDDAASGDVVAVFFKPTDYGVNSNVEMHTVKWVDNDTNEVKNKIVLVCDGKLIDPNGVIIIKKGGASA